MSLHTRVPMLFEAAQDAQHWVNQVADLLSGTERHLAYRLLRAVLQTLRDTLSPEESADLAAQLPLLIRGIYFEGWRPSGHLGRDRRDFMRDVLSRMGPHEVFQDDKDVHRAISAVFHTIGQHVTKGEIEQVRMSLKKSLRQLWPEQ